MRAEPQAKAPSDAAQRRAAPAVVCYTVDRLPPYDGPFYESVRRDLTKVSETIVPPRDARSMATRAATSVMIALPAGPPNARRMCIEAGRVGSSDG